MSGIDQLLALLPPDAPWSEPRRVDWARIEAATGLRFPMDYQELVQRLPPASYSGLLVYHPLNTVGELSDESLASFANLLVVTAESFVGVAENNNAPETFYPESGGLVPWGQSSATGYFWVPTTGDPDQWTTAIYTEVDKKKYFDLPMVDLLALITSGLGPLDIIGTGFQGAQPYWRHKPIRPLKLPPGWG